MLQPKPEFCEKCNEQIPGGVARYSLNVFKKSLCLDCQALERTKKYPKAQAEFLNEEARKKRTLKH